MPQPVFLYGQKEIEHLQKRDKRLGRAIERIGHIEREVTPDLFTALITSIVSQQISAKAADTVIARLLSFLGCITPQRVASASSEAIQQCGMSMRKAQYIHSCAASVLRGDIDLESLHSLDDAAVIAHLSSLKGIGVWTAEMLLIFSMQRGDVVSWGDAAIRRGMMRLYGLPALTKAQFEACRKRYSPYGSTAALYLWELSHES